MTDLEHQDLEHHDLNSENSKPPELKPPNPRYGYYPWWPEDGEDFIHPDDRQHAQGLLPGKRIFRCGESDSKYLTLHYGKKKIRVKRRLWQEIKHEGYEIGDLVEVLSHGLQNQPLTAEICEVLWDETPHQIMYQLRWHEKPHPKSFPATELRHVCPIRLQQQKEYRHEPQDIPGEELELEAPESENTNT